jgi:hypothetical protein
MACPDDNVSAIGCVVDDSVRKSSKSKTGDAGGSSEDIRSSASNVSCESLCGKYSCWDVIDADVCHWDIRPRYALYNHKMDGEIRSKKRSNVH